jgi:hypothetical protein
MTTTGSDIVAGMDVQRENTERIGQVTDVGATGVVVRVQRDLYVPFSAIQEIREGQVVVTSEPDADHRMPEQLLLDHTQDELPMVAGYTVPDTSTFY